MLDCLLDSFRHWLNFFSLPLHRLYLDSQQMRFNTRCNRLPLSHPFWLPLSLSISLSHSFCAPPQPYYCKLVILYCWRPLCWWPLSSSFSLSFPCILLSLLLLIFINCWKLWAYGILFAPLFLLLCLSIRSWFSNVRRLFHCSERWNRIKNGDFLEIFK